MLGVMASAAPGIGRNATEAAMGAQEVSSTITSVQVLHSAKEAAEKTERIRGSVNRFIDGVRAA